MSETTAAYKAGYIHGAARGSWVIDGNTTQATADKIWEGYNDGDPEIMDMCPSPLSGEHTGESINELSAEHGVDLWDSDIATEFEAGFTAGFWDTVQNSIAAMFRGAS